MRDALTTIGELVGFGAVAVGLGLMWLPLGVVGAGASLVLVSALAGRKGAR